MVIKKRKVENSHVLVLYTHHMTGRRDIIGLGIMAIVGKEKRILNPLQLKILTYLKDRKLSLEF